MPRVEQAVFGSFAFRAGGYELLAASPGCRPEWLAAFRLACERYGERPRDASGEGLLVLRTEAGDWMIVGVSNSGADDRGRPGALAFHALFMTDRDYRRLGAWPFSLARHHRRDWGPEDAGLPTLTIEPLPTTSNDEPTPESARIARAIAEGRRVAVESDVPIDHLARQVWAALPARARRRATLATRAFSDALRPDLLGLAVHGRSRLNPADGYLSPADLVPVGPAPGSEPRPRRRRPVALLVGAVVLTLAAGLYASAILPDREAAPPSAHPEPSAPSPPPSIPGELPPPAAPEPPADPATRARVTSGLIDLASRFGVAEPEDFPPGTEPATVMVQIADRLRYRGPTLSEADLARLRDDRSPGRARALEWDAHVHRFLPDRPLPPDFAQGPLRWQLDTFAWSFRIEPDSTLAVEEVPAALAHALAVEGPITTNPLATRYPALSEYARFLETLSRR